MERRGEPVDTSARRRASWKELNARSWITASVYVLVVFLTTTSIYEPLQQGRDDSWLVVLGLVGAHVALGAGVGGPVAIVLAIGVVALVTLIWAPGYAVVGFMLFFAALAAALAGLGILLARLRSTTAIAIVGFMAVVPGAAWGLAETVKRANAPQVPVALEKRLPTEERLGSLCVGAATPKRVRVRLEAQAETLIREVERRPDWLVPYTYYFSEGEDVQHRRITIRELAEEQLNSLEASGLETDPECRPDLQERLRAVLR